MCEYSLVLKKVSGEETKLMESVELIQRQEDGYRASNIFGEEVSFKGEFLLFDGNKNMLVFLEKKEG